MKATCLVNRSLRLRLTIGCIFQVFVAVAFLLAFWIGLASRNTAYATTSTTGSNSAPLMSSPNSSVIVTEELLEDATGAVIYDDFDNGIIDETLWTINDKAGIFSESNGLLQADGPPQRTYAYLYSKTLFSGNWRWILSFQDYYSSATTSGENVPHIALQVIGLPRIPTTEYPFVYVLRSGSESIGQYFITNAKVHKWRQSLAAQAHSNYGQLMIERNGTVVSTFYRDGENPWILLGQYRFPMCPIQIQVNVYTGDDGAFHVGVDKVEVENF